MALHAWANDALITLHFGGGATAPGTITDCYSCEVLPSAEGHMLRLKLKGGGGSRYHSNGIGYKAALAEGQAAPDPSAVKITCDAKMPPPPPPPPPPWCGLRASYKVTGRNDADHGRNGREMPAFEVEVAVEVWEAGAELTLDYGDERIQVPRRRLGVSRHTNHAHLARLTDPARPSIPRCSRSGSPSRRCTPKLLPSRRPSNSRRSPRHR